MGIRRETGHNAIAGYVKERSEKVDQIQDATMDLIHAREFETAPRDTGAMAATVEKKKIDANTREISVGGGEVDYAGYVNGGTEKMAARPFHDDAAQDGRRFMNQQYKGI